MSLADPLAEESGSLNLSIGNNLEIKVLSKKDTTDGGIKKVKIIESLNASTGYNFLADSMKLRNISFNGNTTLFGFMRVRYGAGLDPYQLAKDTNGRDVRVDKYTFEQGKLGRLTSANVSFGMNLNPQARKKKTSSNATPEELEVINRYSEYFVDFNIPWSLNVQYTFNYNKSLNTDSRIDQTMQFSGDLSLSEHWKILLSSGYNFSQKELTLTKIDFMRDLHCWEFSFGWIPAGRYRSFDFTLRVKSSTLQDLKLNRNGFWYDQN